MRRRTFALGIVALPALVSCGASAPTPTIAPTAPPSFRSGGLGKTREEWEAAYQKPSQEQSGAFIYASGTYAVMFTAGRVSYIERRWGDRDAKSLDYAIGSSRPLLPSDASTKQRYKARSGNTVDLFHSPLLATVYAPDAFIGGSAGDFIVIYRDVTGKVTSYVIALGNNP